MSGRTGGVALVAAVAISLFMGPTSGSGRRAVPDRIAFVRSLESRSVIVTIRPDGGEETRVSHARGWSTDPHLSSAGTRLAYQRGLRVYVVDPNGSDRRLVARNAFDPTLTPSGRGLLFQRYRVDSDVAIFRINVDGTGRRELTEGSINVEPAWSPDGTRIVYVRDLDLPQLWVMRRDGSGHRRLTRASGKEDFDPEFSPDGRHVLFRRIKAYGSRCLYRGDVFVVRADGSDPARNLTRTCRRSETSAHWSPDGRRVVFVKRTKAHGLQIYVMHLGGTGVTRLTDGPAPNHSPAWSPDGGQIAFISNRDGNKELYVMNVDGGSQTRLTSTPEAEESSPAW
jgi:Tol biopolymer transport system component